MHTTYELSRRSVHRAAIRARPIWWLRRMSAGLLVLALLACRAGQDRTVEMPETFSDYPSGRLLVEVGWLADHLDDPDVRIVDVRSGDDYRGGHVPGAVNIPVGEISSTINGIPGEFDSQKVQDSLDQAGLIPRMTVVVYDNLGMMDAARFFWVLELVGHQDVRLVNGGWNAWVAQEFEIETAAPEVAPSSYPVQVDGDKLATAEEILVQLDDPQVVIVDARSPQEYTGEVKLADRGGHIPGAVNLVWLQALTGGDTVYTTNDRWRAELEDPDVEVLRSGVEIQALLDDLGIVPDKDVITYCQTLWRGAHVYYVLRLMGFERVQGYDGSWAEWGNQPHLPVVTGSEPGRLDDVVRRIGHPLDPGRVSVPDRAAPPGRATTQGGQGIPGGICRRTRQPARSRGVPWRCSTTGWGHGLT